MAGYRAYRLNAAGKIVHGEWLEATDDAAAKAMARELCDEATPTVELWSGARWVERLPCQEHESA